MRGKGIQLLIVALIGISSIGVADGKGKNNGSGSSSPPTSATGATINVPPTSSPTSNSTNTTNPTVNVTTATKPSPSVTANSTTTFPNTTTELTTTSEVITPEITSEPITNSTEELTTTSSTTESPATEPPVVSAPPDDEPPTSEALDITTTSLSTTLGTTSRKKMKSLREVAATTVICEANKKSACQCGSLAIILAAKKEEKSGPTGIIIAILGFLVAVVIFAILVYFVYKKWQKQKNLEKSTDPEKQKSPVASPVINKPIPAPPPVASAEPESEPDVAVANTDPSTESKTSKEKSLSDPKRKPSNESTIVVTKEPKTLGDLHLHARKRRREHANYTDSKRFTKRPGVFFPVEAILPDPPKEPLPTCKSPKFVFDEQLNDAIVAGSMFDEIEEDAGLTQEPAATISEDDVTKEPVSKEAAKSQKSAKKK